MKLKYYTVVVVPRCFVVFLVIMRNEIGEDVSVQVVIVVLFRHRQQMNYFL